MKRKQLLLLLALLMTAATGAWAQVPEDENVYSNALNTAELFNSMTNIDANEDGTNGTSALWVLQNFATYVYSPQNDADDWLVTPALTLQAGVTYTIALQAQKPSPQEHTYTETFEVKVGSGNTAQDLSAGTVAIATTEVTTSWTTYKGTFTPTEDGTYYVGIHATSPANQSQFSIRNLSVDIKYYTVSLKEGTEDAANWTITSGENSVTGDAAGGLAGLSEKDAVTLTYGGRLKVKSVTATTDAEPAANSVDLSTLTADYEAQNGDVLTGETTSYKVTIAAGATVTLDGATISGNGGCIRCLGDATIILKDGTTNTLTSSSVEYPALSIGDTGTTLTIQGNTGKLIVSSGSNCAGIGGGYKNANNTCGNIKIEGGVITAQGGSDGAGIGSDCNPATCGDIIITGGTVTATGGINGAGIGSGYGDVTTSVCGNITIANTVTKVTATAGNEAPYSIGKGGGGDASCGTVTIGCSLDSNGNPEGGTKYWENNVAVNGGATYLGQSPLIYEPNP